MFKKNAYALFGSCPRSFLLILTQLKKWELQYKEDISWCHCWPCAPRMLEHVLKICSLDFSFPGKSFSSEILELKLLELEDLTFNHRDFSLRSRKKKCCSTDLSFRFRKNFWNWKGLTCPTIEIFRFVRENEPFPRDFVSFPEKSFVPEFFVSFPEKSFSSKILELKLLTHSTYWQKSIQNKGFDSKTALKSQHVSWPHIDFLRLFWGQNHDFGWIFVNMWNASKVSDSFSSKILELKLFSGNETKNSGTKLFPGTKQKTSGTKLSFGKNAESLDGCFMSNLSVPKFWNWNFLDS